jgi:parallel beta-helix repeat protein
MSPPAVKAALARLDQALVALGGAPPRMPATDDNLTEAVEARQQALQTLGQQSPGLAKALKPLQSELETMEGATALRDAEGGRGTRGHRGHTCGERRTKGNRERPLPPSPATARPPPATTKPTTPSSGTPSSGTSTRGPSAPKGTMPGTPGASSTTGPIPSGALNALDLGVQGDGKTDDTQALNAALAMAKKAGVPLYLPPGTFNHSGAIIADGVSIVGAGSSTVLHATSPTHSAVTLTGNGPSLSNVSTTVSAPNRSSQPQDCAVVVQFAQGANVSNVSVQGAAANGIRLDRASGSTIANNIVNGSNADGIALVNGSTNNLITRCEVIHASDDSFSSDSYPGEPVNTGNVFDGCYAGPNHLQGRSFALMGSVGETIRNSVSEGSLWHGVIAGTDPNSTTTVGSGHTVENTLVLRNASGLPVAFTDDGGVTPTKNAAVGTQSGITTSGDPASVLGWTPTLDVAKPSTFSSYTGGGPGAANTPGART